MIFLNNCLEGLSEHNILNKAIQLLGTLKKNFKKYEKTFSLKQ